MWTALSWLMLRLIHWLSWTQTCTILLHTTKQTTTNSVVLVRERTIPTERSPLFGEVSSNFWGTGCLVVSATYPQGHIIGFLDRSLYPFFQVAPHLYSQGWVDPVPDPLLLRKSGSAGYRTQDLWIRCQELWPLDHKGSVTYKTGNFLIS
jgi:hypothetical protein